MSKNRKTGMSDEEAYAEETAVTEGDAPDPAPPWVGHGKARQLTPRQRGQKYLLKRAEKFVKACEHLARFGTRAYELTDDERARLLARCAREFHLAMDAIQNPKRGRKEKKPFTL